LSTTILNLKSSQNSKRNHVAAYENISVETRYNLLATLAKEKYVSLHRVLHPYSETQVPRQFKTPLPCRMTSLYNKDLTSMSITEIEILCEDLIHHYDVTTTQRDLIEELTREQSTCIQWNHHREGRVTGSNCYSVSRANLDKPAKSLVQKIVYPVECKFRSDATEYLILCYVKLLVITYLFFSKNHHSWGITHENIALQTLRKYFTERGNHSGFTFEKTGFVISLCHSYIGASPDGILKCPCYGKSVVEVKCPYTHRNDTLWNAAITDDKFCLSAGGDGILRLKNNHPYFYQVQLSMETEHITNLTIICNIGTVAVVRM
jgi:hypothetical protein